MNYKLFFIISLFLFQPLLASTPQIPQQELQTIISQGNMLAIEKYITDMSTKMRYGLEEPQVDFEIFYPLLSRRGFKNNTYHRIIERLIYSEPKDIETVLFKALIYVPLSSKQQIIKFLVKQKYQPIFNYLLEMKHSHAYTFEDFSFVCEALAKFNSVESMEAAIDCIKLPFADERMINGIFTKFRYDSNNDTPLKFKIFKTDGVFKIINNLPILEKKQVIKFLAEQKYQQLFNYLLEMNSSYSVEDLSIVCETLVKLGNVESVKIAMDCIKLPFANKYMIRQILSELHEFSNDISLDFKVIKTAVTPHFDDIFVKRRYHNLIAKFQVEEEIPLLFKKLINDLNNNNIVGSKMSGKLRVKTINTLIVNTLFKFNNKEVSERVSKIIDKAYKEGKIDQHTYNIFNGRKLFIKKSLLQERPVVLQSPKFTPTQNFLREQQRINKINDTVNSLRNNNPDLYIQVYTKYLAELANLIKKYPNSESEFFLTPSKGYFQLANFIRFSQNNPQQAIKFYEKTIINQSQGVTTELISNSASNEQLDIRNLIGIADIYQYALNQPEKAIKYYSILVREIEQSKKSHDTERNMISIWLKNWLENEINYLQTGQPFYGEIGNERIKEFMMVLYFMPAMFVNDVPLKLEKLPSIYWDNPKITKKGRKFITNNLMNLVPSHLVLLKTYIMVALMETPEDILQYLAKHDPAGYWTANLFGMVLYIGKQSEDERNIRLRFFPGLKIHSATDQPLGMAAQQYFNEHKLQIADSRFSTPEKTMQLYLKSLRNKDVETAYICFSNKSFRKSIQQSMPKASLATLQRIADRYTNFKITKQTEHSAIASTKYKLKNGEIQKTFFHLENIQGKWKMDPIIKPE